MGKGRMVVEGSSEIAIYPRTTTTHGHRRNAIPTMPRGDDDVGDDDVRRNHPVLFIEDVHGVVLCSELWCRHRSCVFALLEPRIG